VCGEQKNTTGCVKTEHTDSNRTAKEHEGGEPARFTDISLDVWFYYTPTKIKNLDLVIEPDECYGNGTPISSYKIFYFFYNNPIT
jgi:hypothetical protein